MLKKICLLLAIVICSVISAPFASAKSGDVVMHINPSEQDLELEPGHRYESSITVYNVGRLGFDFEVSISPYQTQNTDYSPDFSTESAYTRITEWITLPQTEFHVEPGYAEVVNFVIDVPDNVPGGGQYAAIMVRPKNNSDENDASIKIVGQIAAIIYGHVNGDEVRADGSMLEHHFPSFILGNNFSIASTFENTGNIDYRVIETLSIRNFFTNEEIITPLTLSSAGHPLGTLKASVLPGTTRVVSMSWTGAPQLGIFRVTNTISYLDHSEVYEKVVVLCPLWLIVLFAIFIIIIIIAVVSYFRRQRKNEPQAFW